MNGCYHKQGQSLKAFGRSPTPKLSPQVKPGTTPPPPRPNPKQFNEFDFCKTTVLVY